MRQRRTAAQTRELIFKACTTILCREGLPTLTLDAVAQEAGLSKGGLLYHFPTKLALLEALFTYHLEKFDLAVQNRFEAEEEAKPGRWLRAYAEASVEQIIDPDTASVFASLFAAGERYPSVLEIMRQRYVVWQQHISKDGLDPAMAMLIRMVVDGLWFTQLYQYSPPDAALRAKVFELLATLTGQSNNANQKK